MLNSQVAVEQECVLLVRVQRTLFSLLYSELEIVRTFNDKDIDNIFGKLDYIE